MRPTAISVTFEIGEIELALEGARILADVTRFEPLSTEHDTVTAPRAAAAILNLAVARLEQLRRVLRGDLDAAIIAAHFNETVRVDDDDPHEVPADVILPIDRPRVTRHR